MSGADLEFHIALRSEVAIEAPPQIVWDYLDRQQEWKPSIVSLERRAGNAGEAGEVLRIGQRPGDETVHVFMQMLRVTPNTWRVQTLVTEASNAVDGYVLYSLRPEGSTTQLCCEFVARCRIPVATAGDVSPAEMASRTSAATAAKLDADHQLLKALVERAPPA